MIRIKPYNISLFQCNCGGKYYLSEILWQGVHVCERGACRKCGKILYKSIEVNQASIQPCLYYPDNEMITDTTGNVVASDWFSSKLRTFLRPVERTINMDVRILRKCEKIIILNTLDYVYGHSFLFLMNLQRLLRSDNGLGIVVILQPMLKWLLPNEGIAEIWTVDLQFNELINYYSDLNSKINMQLKRFDEAYLSKGYVIPTNLNIRIEEFTGIKPYNFLSPPAKKRVTYIWREDPDRLWIRNIYLLKGSKKLGLKRLLIPLQYIRVIAIFQLLKRKLGPDYLFTIAGLGHFWSMPSFIDDKRTDFFSEESERRLCEIYSESEVVFGVHGSAMILPSAHSGMVLSLMPSKRWANFAEDILFNESDVRLASFQRRVVPLNISIIDLRDIIADMILGRDYFIKKFKHSEEL